MPILPAKPSTRAAARPTEGTPRGISGAGRYKRTAGRPPGAKNKSKSLVKREVADVALESMQMQVPPEHYEYMREVLIEGKAPNAKKEIQIMAFLLARNIWPAVIQEMNPVDDNAIDEETASELGITKKAPEFRKDVTERLKLWFQMWDRVEKIEARENGQDSSTQSKPVLEIFARGGVGPDRIAILIGSVPGSVGGNANGVGREEDSIRTVSDTIPERQLSLSGGEQV